MTPIAVRKDVEEESYVNRFCDGPTTHRKRRTLERIVLRRGSDLRVGLLVLGDATRPGTGRRGVITCHVSVGCGVRY